MVKFTKKAAELCDLEYDVASEERTGKNGVRYREEKDKTHRWFGE